MYTEEDTGKEAWSIRDKFEESWNYLKDKIAKFNEWDITKGPTSKFYNAIGKTVWGKKYRMQTRFTLATILDLD